MVDKVNDFYNNLALDGKTMAEWDAQEEQQQQLGLSEGISFQEASTLGLLEDESTETDSTREFEKLSAGETVKDVGKSVGKEALKVFVPKKDGLANKTLNKVGLGSFNEEDLGLNYEAKTRVGETFKYLYRYGAGTIASIYTGGAVGGAMAASKVATVAKAGAGLRKLMLSDKLFKTSKSGAKALGVKLLNAYTAGAVGGAVADFALYRPEEGHLADMFGNSDLVRPFQTQDDDSEFEGKLKNVFEGLLIGGVVGVGLDTVIKPLAGKWFKNLKKATTTNSEEEALEALTEAAEASSQIKAITDVNDVYNAVKDIKQQVDLNGADALELIQKNIPAEYQTTAREMYDITVNGDEVFFYSNGQFGIKVSKWEDVYKLTPEQHKEQLKRADDIKGEELIEGSEVRYGDTAIEQMDATVKSTWENRGWIGEGDSSLLKPKNKDGVTVVNQKIANKVAKHYTDKWEIDNNVKVEVIESLKDAKGNPVSGRTESTKYHGKTTNNKQNAIDKKKLQITKLEDKITQLEGGNEPVTDALDNLKEELRIAKNELKDLEKAAKNKNRIPNITIQIDANCKNPYSVLRSELEHARDIAKGTVPDQSKQHFSRYEGLNEGEMASGYVHKKSTSRAPKNSKENLKDFQVTTTKSDAFGENPDVIESDYTPYTIHSIKNDKGNKLGHIRIVDGNYIQWMENSKIEKAAIRKLIAKLLYDNKYQSLVWDATTESSVKSYNYFCKEYPDLVNRIQYTDKYSQIDNKPISNYTQEKGVMNEGSQGNNTVSERGQVLRGYSISSDSQKVHATSENKRPNRADKSGVLDESNSATNERGSTTNPNNASGLQSSVGQSTQYEQLKLDFNSVEDVAESVVKGDLKNMPEESLDVVVDDIVNKNYNYDKTTWEEFLNNVEAITDPVIKQVLDTFNYEQVLRFAGNPDKFIEIVKRQVGCVKLQQVLSEQLLTVTDKQQKRELMNTITALQNRIDVVRSYSGLALNIQKPIHYLQDAFKDKTLTQFEEEGIKTLIDIVRNSIKDIDLNFTRGELVNKKQEIIAKFIESLNSELLTVLKNPDIEKVINDSIDKILKEGKFDEVDLTTNLVNLVTDKRIAQIESLMKQAPLKEGKSKIATCWQHIQDYYIHNLLSGFGTVVKGVISGLTNMAYNPAVKIVAGQLFSGGDALSKQGLGEYRAWASNLADAWMLAKEAFMTGEGTMNIISRDTLADTNIKPFNNLRDDDTTFLGHIQNIHSIMTRLMGASDEFMSQLNYRNIIKSKAYVAAEELAKNAGKSNDVKWIDDIAQKIFNGSFDASTGKPLDMKAYYETKKLLYQNNLDGSVINPITGEKQQVEAVSSVMRAGQAINEVIAKLPVLKLALPFVKTGVNILDMNLKHSPIYPLLSKNQRELLQSATEEGAMARARLAFGSISMFALTCFAFSGGFTGSLPRDEKTRKALLASGWKPYSFVTPSGKYISYQGYEPYHTLFGFAADTAELFSSITTDEDFRNANKIIMEGYTILVNNFFDKAAFRGGVDAISSAMSLNEEELEKTLANIAQGMLPDSAMVKGISTLGKRDATSPQTFMERWFNLYMNRGLGEYRRNCFGEKQNITNLIVSNFSQVDDNPEDVEIMRLAELGFKPAEISKTLSQTNYNFKDFKDAEGRNAYDYMMEALSESDLREAIRNLVTSDYYKSLPDGVLTDGQKDDGIKYSSSDYTKINELKALFIEYNNQAKEDVMVQHPELVNNKGVTLGDAREIALMNKMNSLVNQGLQDTLNDLNNFY